MGAQGKTPVRDLLEARDHAGLLRQRGASRQTLKALLSLTFDASELIRWRAVEAIGKVSGTLAEDDPERVRNFLRRLLWSMNDESGGHGWHAPEAIGEILVNAPSLIPELGVLLTASLRRPPFERGSHLAVYRVACLDPSPFTEFENELADSLIDSDPAVRGHAALALGAIGAGDRRVEIEALLTDPHAVTVYDFDTGLLAATTVRDMAASALRRLLGSDSSAG